jgi:tetratricopeptide (TPR) repeat protein
VGTIPSVFENFALIVIIASDAPAEAKPVAFLKNLLFQLLERNVGDARLYEKLVKAFETHSEHKDADKLQVALWEALEAGLKTVNDANVNLIIVVDGFDEIVSKDNHGASHLHQRLHKCVDKFLRTRAITLSKPISHLGSAGCKHLVITPDHTHDDITAYLRQSMTKHQHYISQSRGTQEEFVKKLVHEAKGSFLWAYLVVKSQAMETSYENYFNAGEAMHSDVHSLLHKLVGKIDLKNATTKHMLPFMLAAERPLTVGEMADLLSVNLHKRTLMSEVTDLSKHIAATCSVLIVERKGLIRFKHSAIRRFMLELCGKSLMSLKEAHSELTKRMLFYAKYRLSVSYEPSFDGLSSTVVEDTFRSHYLMEYVVRNWIGHFRSSTLCGATGELILSSEFKDIFPDSTFFAMIEWSCWQSQTSVIKAMEFHDLALSIRTACFGEKHRSVMQTLIIMGSFHRTRSDLIKASEFFYRASCIGQAVLYKFTTVVVVCTNSFLTCTETITITKRTEIVTYREEMIRFMIEICKCKHGASSDHVIRWYELLAKLYIDIKEEHRATIVYKELYEIIVMRFGKGSDRARGISETLGGMTVVLKGGKSEEEIVEYEEWIFETSEEMEVTDELRISIILRLCKTYEAHGKWFLAEKLYINLWRRISEICRIKASIELHLVKINIALEYVRFLQRIERIEEASNILICLWAEYEHHSFESETIIIRIKEIGTLFRAFGLLSVAVSVFAKVWGWFKSKGKTTQEEAVSTTALITEVIEEITETTTTTKTTTTTTTAVTETVVKEIFETTYTRCKNSKVDIHLFKTCMALINLYSKQEKWSECEVIIKRSLELTWKAVLTVDTKIALSGSFIQECILVATQLAFCYHRQRYFEKAEEIYLRIYRACLVSFSIEDIRVTEASLVLIRFYEEYHRHDKVIEIYIELLHGYRKHLGASHKLTIKALYALGSICIMLGRKEAYEYYVEIVTTLNKGGHCHHDAFEAAVIV